MRNVGVEVANPDTLELDRDRAEDYVAQLRARMKREVSTSDQTFSTHSAAVTLSSIFRLEHFGSLSLIMELGSGINEKTKYK